MKEYRGQCLCGRLKYSSHGKPSFPHLCSCRTCQTWSGALTVAWVEFPIEGFQWSGDHSEPAWFQSSQQTQRGRCPTCGSAMCALDDGSDKIAVTMATLDTSSGIVPGKQHSFVKSAPSWWAVAVTRPQTRAKPAKTTDRKSKTTRAKRKPNE